MYIWFILFYKFRGEKFGENVCIYNRGEFYRYKFEKGESIML